LAASGWVRLRLERLRTLWLSFESEATHAHSHPCLLAPLAKEPLAFMSLSRDVFAFCLRCNGSEWRQGGTDCPTRAGSPVPQRIQRGDTRWKSCRSACGRIDHTGIGSLGESSPAT